MELKGQRLYLRNWKASDREAMFRYAKDPAVGPIAGWPAHRDISESEAILQVFQKKPECFAICLNDSEEPIGAIELKLQGNSDLVQSDREAELGYWLGKPWWCNGYMPEAASVILRHAFEDLGLERVWCGHYEGNLRSRRVMEKNGFQYRWTTEHVDVPLLHEVRRGYVFCIEKTEWEALRQG